ncbi:hypothetical protein BDZ97DRAFT_1812020 [Flammula alnicola]|nr:hypothetical protein BDZ97DRAFT_1812020 [Flammula alnicola]
MLQSPTGPSNWMKVSPLEVLITRACEPSLHEPNYALHLEVAEYIDQKKANNPREAAMMIARLANHRNPHIAILSLALLDTLSSHEFLNELVRRFPERPPPFPGPVMSRILELINGWKEGICVESRWKEDLGNIRDMHRLLTFKGYRFRDAQRGGSNTALFRLLPWNLKSAEELEEEDRAAQSAKLQELIRRGTPRDLAAAQELMKALAGANPDAKPDYRSQALTELNKLEQKVILLNEMLDNVDVSRGEKFVTGDAYDQVSSILIAARPKLQKWISDAETDDPESLDTFLQINDQINTVLTRYEAFKKGDYTFAANPIPQELSNNAGSSTGVSLIDLDDSAPTTNAEAGGANDLSGLFSQPVQQPVRQAIQQQQQFGMPQGFGGMPPPFMAGVQAQQQPPQPQVMQPHAPTPLFHNGSAFARPNSMSPPYSQSATPPAAIVLPGTPGPAPAQLPNYFGNGGAGGKAPMGVANTGTGMGLDGMGAGLGMGMGSVGGSSSHLHPNLGMGSGMGMAMSMGMGQPQTYAGMGLGQTFGGSPQPQPQQQYQQHQQQLGFQPQQPQQIPQQQQAAVASTGATPSVAAGQQGKDPFADLAGLF